MSRRLRLVLATLAVLWAAAVALAPALPTVVAATLYAAGSLICHQIAERSFHLGAFQLPVCARCFGLYAGGAAGAVASIVAARPWRPAMRHRLGLTIVAAVPTLATWVLEHGLGWPFSNMARAVAALPLAAVMAFVVSGGAPTLHYDGCAPRRPIGQGQCPPPANT